MIPANKYSHLWIKCGWLLIAVACFTAVCFFSLYIILPGPDSLKEHPDPLTSPSWLKYKPVRDCNWQIFKGREDVPSRNKGLLSQRLRLAGTYFEYDSEGVSDIRKAIIDDLKVGEQIIVTENEKIDEIRIVSIFRDRIVLRDSSGETELWLSFSGPEIASSNLTDPIEAGQTAGPENLNDTGYDRFGGKQVGERRWLFQRESLMKYYRELLDEPERLVSVFDSLRPLYNDENRITGYELHVEGESDFFASAGLLPGDRIRMVNSTPMTSRRLAENFIRDFVENRASAFVLGVERQSQTQKFIYQLDSVESAN